MVFSVADFDAYANPYQSFEAFWTEAPKTSPLVCCFTDGIKHALLLHRMTKVWDLAAHCQRPATINEARGQYNFWFRRHALPHVQSVVSPCQVRNVSFYTRRNMIYWGCVIHG